VKKRFQSLPFKCNLKPITYQVKKRYTTVSFVPLARGVTVHDVVAAAHA
jgi:hypothetical protein